MTRIVLPLLLLAMCQAGLYGRTIVSGEELVEVSSDFASLDLLDRSTLTMYAGADIARVYAYDDSSVNVFGGHVSWLRAYGQSTVDVQGGDISWLFGYDEATINIRDVDDLSWLILDTEAAAHVYGRDLQWSNGHLSGRWSDGRRFNFWALKDSLYGPDDTRPENLFLHNVPEPSVAIVFFAAFATLVWSARRCQSGFGG